MNKIETTAERRERFLVEFENDPAVKMLRILGHTVTREIYISFAFSSEAPDNPSEEYERRLPEILKKDFPKSDFQELFTEYLNRPPVKLNRSEYQKLVMQIRLEIMKTVKNDLQSGRINLEEIRAEIKIRKSN